MYLAAAGALVQQLRLEVLANNVANINTSGFKGEQAVFQIPEENADQVIETPLEGVHSLSPYAPPFGTVTDFSQGALQRTGNPLDLALNGKGFFSIQTPSGVQYTRQGSFTIDAEGVLVTQDGYPVMGEGGTLSLEEGTVDIDEEGVISVDDGEVGRLQIIEFFDPQVLQKTENGRFVPVGDGPAGRRPETVLVSQGFLEASNVNPVRAMTEMIETSRMFEAYQKVINTADEATAQSINEVGTTA
jgi:flagellar basal-body rod protein FlgG